MIRPLRNVLILYLLIGLISFMCFALCHPRAAKAAPDPAQVHFIVALDRPTVLVPEGFARDGAQVAWCESGFDPDRTGAAGELSVWQIHPVHRTRAQRMGYTWAQARDPIINTEIAVAIWQEQGFRPWACRP